MRKFLSLSAKSSLVPYLIILLLGTVIYLNLQGKLLFNPDFAQSDIYHGYGIRYFLAENLQNDKLPFWTDKWLGGFPFFSEWQAGSLFLPNVIAYRFLPFKVAVNALHVYVFLALSTGFYLLLREFKVNRWVALLISLNFTFNGSIVFRLTHVSLLHTFSLCPLLFYLVVRFLKTDRRIYLLFIPLCLSQMIFAGFIPVIYITMFGLLLFVLSYLLIILKYGKRKICITLLHLGLSFMMGICISLPQILSSLTLSGLSSRPLNLDFGTITAYPFPLNNLINFISPFIFGNPKEGTYPLFHSDWGVFWENAPYAGAMMVFLLYISLLFIFFRKTNIKRFLLVNLAIMVFFLLLVLGKYSPLYFLFEFPPFNLFRTQSRFLIMVCFFLFFTSGLSLNYLYTKSSKIVKCLVIILLLYNLSDLVSVQRNYHLFSDASYVLAPPKFISLIRENESYVTMGMAPYWNNVFLKSGWKTDKEISKYIFYKNFLNPNANLLYDRKIYDIANGLGFKPRRNEYLKSVLLDHLSGSQDGSFSLQNTKNLLELLGIKYVIAPWEITDPAVVQTAKISLEDESIYLYDFRPGYRKANDFMYSPATVKLIVTLTDFENLINENNDFTSNATIEKTIAGGIVNRSADYQITNSKVKEDSLEITAEFSNPGLIVFRKNYYPGWRLSIDNLPAGIEKINLVHMGTFIPKGKHTIRLYYRNTDFENGLVIAIVSYTGFLVYIFRFPGNKKGVESDEPSSDIF